MDRSALHALNAGAILLTLILGGSIALVVAHAAPRAPLPGRSLEDSRIATRDAAGLAVVLGGDGVAVRIQAYHRIVSLVPEADDALVELGLLDRIAAISAYSRGHSTRAPLLRLVPGTIASGAGVEDLLACHPDLIVVAAFSDQGRSAQLRSAGIAVFHLGAEQGAHDAAMAVRRLAALCGVAAAGEQVATRFERRLAHVGDPAWHRLSGCFVSCSGTRLFGGSTGTSYADILQAAGIDDAAAAHGYVGFTTYRLEDLLAIAPEVIVTGTGMGAQLSGMPGASSIPAIAHHRLIEIDTDLLDAPGLAILEAAEAVAAGRERLP